MEEKIPEKYDHRAIEPKWPHSAKASRGKEGYNHRLIEPKWERLWEKSGIYKAVDFDKKPKKYVLVEFPYPSGDRLHVGHGRSYTALDAMARKFRMQGFNVMFPMGWDAFGLPTENYAIKNKVNPNVVVKENIAHAKAQAKRWGLSVDWDREIDTTDPKYYKWTQWIFVQLFKKGLAYRSEVAVNWCPFCKTNLANEEVLSDGIHERCGNKTERRMQKQWILKITKYADRLLEDLKTVDYLPKIANQQINWIGRSEGAQINFQIVKLPNCELKVFTTRPDTLYGATFMVISPEHELVKKILEGQDGQGGSEGQEIRKYIERAKMKTELERIEETKDKTGIFSGLYAINPVTEKEIPIWISDFVLSSYGTGAIMAVPAHDGRDFAFAKKFGLPITRVIGEDGEGRDNKGERGERLPYCEAKGVLIDSGDWNGFKVPEEMGKIIFWLEEKGIGKKEVSYHLRDWVFSRQHYWGEPIPMIFCPQCAKDQIRNSKFEIRNSEMAGWWPVPEEELPVELPYLEQYEPSGTGESPLSKVESWVNTKCPHCGGNAKRETDTMPNWAGSNWYYVAYLLANKLRVQSAKCKVQSENESNIFSENKELLKYWLPVDLYNGGMEHTTLHLLYSRFIYKFLFDIGVVPTSEPYTKRRSHGMVLGPDSQKMSKSRGNVINPDEIIEAFGADTFRLYESFMGPFDQVIAWSPESLEGCYRFLKRVWGLVQRTEDGRQKTDSRGQKTEDRIVLRKLNQTIKKVGEDIDNMKFNTAVAAMMELLNEMDKGDKKDKTDKSTIEKFLLILAPFAPHVAEELWEKLGNSFSIHQQNWPEYDPSLIEEDIVTVAVQVNGKLRGTIELPIANCKLQNEVERMAKENEKVKKYLEEPSFAKATAGKQEIKKTIYIPGKLINFVI